MCQDLSLREMQQPFPPSGSRNPSQPRFGGAFFFRFAGYPKQTGLGIMPGPARITQWTESSAGAFTERSFYLASEPAELMNSGGTPIPSSTDCCAVTDSFSVPSESDAPVSAATKPTIKTNVATACMARTFCSP